MLERYLLLCMVGAGMVDGYVIDEKGLRLIEKHMETGLTLDDIYSGVTPEAVAARAQINEVSPGWFEEVSE